MTERFWGEVKDREAAKQLGLEGDQTIFMMGIEVDYLDDEDLHEIETEFDERGYVDAEDVTHEVRGRIRGVKLPKGYVFVGMKPVDAEGPKTYGIVELSALGLEAASED